MRYRILVSSLFIMPSIFAFDLQTHRLPDQRIKQLWFPEQSFLSADASEEDIALQFLGSRAADFGLSVDLGDMRLVRKQESLLGYHLTYQQYLADLPVDTGLVTVSILKKDRRIYQVYNSVHPQESLQLLAQPQINLEEAYDKAWQHLGVSGELFESPKAELILKPVNQGVRPIYRIILSTTSPYGVWQVDVDAVSGKIINAFDSRIDLGAKRKQPIFGKRAATSDRQAAFQKWESIKTASSNAVQAETVEGIAKLFDPDPRTSTGNRALEDDSPAQDFSPAYVERILPDISLQNGVYRLEGPWVKLIDFDAPRTAPSTSRDGRWFFNRGQNAFNDAMTYYHIDKSQRYIQSLGFRNETGIQFNPIEVDSDGANGDDNSYFIPSSNRLAFGHGCVDDNEDVDVILHEYGHAIHNSINPNWGGGDTGAMGEGFGDYWAASHSYSLPEGQNFFPFEIYTWDGHGAGNCWPGRILNADEALYNPSVAYGPHAPISGGFQSDELWATPLFQAHVALRARGISREEIDTIVLQAQFGLGSGLKMPDMAQAIIATARMLYPNGPHAAAFHAQFLKHQILKEPAPKLTLSSEGLILPGQSAELILNLSNVGDLVAQGATLQLSSNDSLLQIEDGELAFGDLAINESQARTIRLKLASEAACGHPLRLQARVRYDDDKLINHTLELRAGRAVELTAVNREAQNIPDNSATGIISSIEVNSDGQISPNLEIPLDIRHSYRGDLKVTLTSPSGRTILLHNRSGGADLDLVGSYPKSLTAVEALSAFHGENQRGTWRLHVQDLGISDEGELLSWGIHDISGYECR